MAEPFSAESVEPELVFSDGDDTGAHADFEPDGADEEELVELLSAVQRAVWRHPIAVQAAFAALVREGKRFAETPEGAELLAALSRSPTLARARNVWEVVTLSAFEAEPEGALPSVFLDTLVRGLKVRALEPLLARLFERRVPR